MALSPKTVLMGNPVSASHQPVPSEMTDLLDDIQAAAVTNYGINVRDATVHTSSFTVTPDDYGKHHILKPSLGTTITVSMNDCYLYAGNVISFEVHTHSYGDVKFNGATAHSREQIAFYTETYPLRIWGGECLTLRAPETQDKWQVVDFNKRMMRSKGEYSAGDVSMTGSAVSMTWADDNTAGTYEAYGTLAYNSSTSKFKIPRTGRFLLEAKFFLTWTGTVPSTIYGYSPLSGSGVSDRTYATHATAGGGTQASLHLRQVINGLTDADIDVYVNCIGGTGSKVASGTYPSILTLTELAP